MKKLNRQIFEDGGSTRLNQLIACNSMEGLGAFSMQTLPLVDATKLFLDSQSVITEGVAN
jgi:hypothetical protein